MMKPALAKLGIAPFSPAEMVDLVSKLKNELEIGLNRKGEAKTITQGLLAIPNPIKVPSQDSIRSIPQGTRVLTAALAGTNWKLSLAEFTGTGSPLKLTELATQPIPENQRQFPSPEAFAGFITEFILKGAGSLNQSEILPILAIALAFPQKTLRSKHGLDAQLPCSRLSKFWRIRRGKGMLIGQQMLALMHQQGQSFFQQVVITNDTVAVALDQTAAFGQKFNQPILPVGFVFGTGSNASLEWRDRLINLEIGMAQLLGYDPVLRQMERLNQTATTVPWLEHYTGGAYLIKRLACGLMLIEEKGLLQTKIGAKLLATDLDSSLLSQLAANQLSREAFATKVAPLTTTEFNLVKQCSRGIMTKSAQVAAIMISAVANTAGWSAGVMPVEGSVFWRAQVSPQSSFVNQVEQTLNGLLSDHQLAFIPGSGLRGIATLAMI